jgi:hypothetical protein
MGSQKIESPRFAKGKTTPYTHSGRGTNILRRISPFYTSHKERGGVAAC